MDEITLKFRVGKYLYPVRVTKNGSKLEFTFKYNAALLDEIRVMEGAKWHGYDDPPRKVWSVKDSVRNRFQIRFLSGAEPYKRYDQPIPEFVPSRPECYKHQALMAGFFLARRQCEGACEMGTGKTLAAIEAIEASGCTDVLWCGPRAALYSVQLEFRKWKAKITPTFVTYDGLRKLVETWPKGKKPPQFFVLDEASKVKNPTAQRSQAAFEMADMIRATYGDDAYIILLSGSPAPKSPADWWHQCEVACPGFIREGTYIKFQQRLAILRSEEAPAGGKFYKIVTWKDDENKCAECGKLADDPNHDISMGGHPWMKSVNEVSYLYKRMSGLVLVQFKKDCLDLPEKIYRTIKLRPTGEILRSASLIKANAPTTIQALTLLRELSDGFQYKEEATNEVEKCPVCNGTKVVDHWYDLDDPENPLDQNSIACGHRIVYDPAGSPVEQLERPLRVEKGQKACPGCDGVGERFKINRIAKEFPTPKEDALKGLLEELEEEGRLVTYGAFTGSVDRIVRISKEMNWHYIRADGRGWESSLGGTPTDMLEKFMDTKTYERVNFIGQAGAAGMGLNLTASSTICYWSNDYNAESRIQSEDRIHRPGADKIRGCNILDLIHLPSDQLILDNLKVKRDLQRLTLGQFRTQLDQLEKEWAA